MPTVDCVRKSATVTLVLMCLAFSNCSFAQDSSAEQLPGAIPVIEASRYPSIQAALDAVGPAGGIVRLPPGEFKITEALRIQQGDVRLEGSGAGTNLVNLNEAGEPAILVAHPDRDQVKQKDRLWRVNLSNFRITGNEKSGAGIQAILVEEIFIQGVSVSRCGGDGILLDRCYEDPRISNCLLTYNKQVGLNLLGCHDIVVSANQFEENQDALHCIDSFNLCMTGNCVDDHLDKGVVIENTYGSVVSGNMIEECNGTAITLDRDCYGITLSANVIAHNGAGINLVDAHGCTVSANTFTIMKTDALKIGPESGRITVTGNNFSNSYIGQGGIKRAADDEAAAGLILEGCREVIITGNLFSSIRPKAVSVSGEVFEITFANNVIVDAESDLKNGKD